MTAPILRHRLKSAIEEKIFWNVTLPSSLIFFCKRYLQIHFAFHTFICIWNRVRSVCVFFFSDGGLDGDNFQRSKVPCILFSWVRGEVAGTRRLRRQRPSLPLPNSLVTRVLSLPSSYFYPVRLYDVFLCNEESKTLNRRLVKLEMVSFLHCASLEKRRE